MNQNDDLDILYDHRDLYSIAVVDRAFLSEQLLWPGHEELAARVSQFPKPGLWRSIKYIVKRVLAKLI